MGTEPQFFFFLRILGKDLNKQNILHETKRKQHLEYLLCNPVPKRAQTPPQFATFSAGYFFSLHLTDGKDSVNFLKQLAGPPPLS